MIIQRIPPLANDHMEGPATGKWSSGGSGLLQMIIWKFLPLANDHPEEPAFCKWSSGGIGLLQMIIRHAHHPRYVSQDPDSISWTILEQFVLVNVFLDMQLSPIPTLAWCLQLQACICVKLPQQDSIDKTFKSHKKSFPTKSPTFSWPRSYPCPREAFPNQ